MDCIMTEESKTGILAQVGEELEIKEQPEFADETGIIQELVLQKKELEQEAKLALESYRGLKESLFEVDQQIFFQFGQYEGREGDPSFRGFHGVQG